ncbi:C2H2 zinc finger [Rhizoctonia solani]|uniref:C2H2 zinc finger n=1 Tax=Rhizoctonia solani TaxID=456999 RepID=A0A8H8T1D4_9AGAM|nr:C2H2 zinc finger [Rhizoctonia solani]QRW24627.1 C2H2 zinc finger [Rhizoctonia solani]
MASSSQGLSADHNEPGKDTDSETTNVDTGQTSEKLLGKRRARESPGASNLQIQEEDSLSDRDADWEPEDIEISISPPGSASKFVRLASEPDDRSQHSQSSPGPSPGPSMIRGVRGAVALRHRRTPRTRSSGREGSSGEYDSLPNEAPNFSCRWVPLQFPEQEPCKETCTRLSDLRRHQRPHFEIDLSYAKEKLDEVAVSKAQAALDRCAGRGQSYACEVCGKVYSRLDAVARHRQQPQGKYCNIMYKKMRAEEKARAKESQGLEQRLRVQKGKMKRRLSESQKKTNKRNSMMTSTNMNTNTNTNTSKG